MNKLLLPLLIGALLAGCAASPFQRPAAELPDAWQTAGAGELPQQADAWWQGFDDPALTALIHNARQRNADLAQAAIRLRRAELAADLSQSDARPGVSGSVSGSGSRSVDRSDNWKSRYGSNLQLSYEVDLWGKVDASLREKREQLQASRYDLEATRIKLEADTAQLYWDIATLQARQDAARRDVADGRSLLNLAQSRYRHGAQPRSDVWQAEQQLLQREQTLRGIASQLAAKRNALAILQDLPPGKAGVGIAPLPLTPTLPPLGAGLPASLLSRRPDLMASEARLRAQLAQVDVARTSFYPALSLTGSLGTGSSALSELLKNPLATLGASLSLPFLEFHKRELELASQREAYREAELKFRADLYTALAEVDDILEARQRLAQDATAKARELDLAQKDEAMTQSRYRAGDVAFKTVLDAGNARRQAETALVELRRDQLNNLAQLYKALGGAPV